MRIVHAVVVLTLLISAPLRAEPAPTFIGEWETTYGLMRLAQKEDAVEGTYGPAGEASVTGKLDGRKLTFKYAEPQAGGEGWFELAADGNSFQGQWRENGAPKWAQWTGKRRAGAVAVRLDTFDGLWKTTYGAMRLHQTGNDVRGTYNFGGGSNIRGTVDGKTFKFTYDQPDGEKGEGAYELAADGKGFKGTWQGAKGGANNGGQWTGTRVTPQPGRIWLVVLEANWERDLEQEEYSFGVMLRTFFARTPQVKVRHRFFSDESQFRHWCAELPYLAEPVVLHVSSHGTTEGITCGGKTINAKALAECVKDIGDLRLLHFGACMVAGGDVPKQMHEALGPAATFPISGYKNVADWGGSAVIDFTFLDLMFSKGFAPEDAIRKTRKLLTFAGEQGGDGAIAPAGLLVIPAPPRK